MSTKDEIRALIDLQRELDAKRDEFITRIKALLESERAKGNHHILVDLDGEFYQLVKGTESMDAMQVARKHGGFYHDYYFVRRGKPL